MAFYLGPGGAGDATGDAASQASLATQKAAEAAASASSALSSQATAATASVNAVTAASNAATSATNAASSVSSISALASASSAAATTATTKAAEAAASASSSGTSASSAATQATAASTSASSASSSASSASSSASSASSSASSASSSVTTATTKAAESSTSATNASNSATAAANSAATFTDSFIRSKFSAGGSLVYNASTGVFSYTPSAVAAAGAVTQVQYNSAGFLAGSANFTFNGTSLAVSGGVTAQAFLGNAINLTVQPLAQTGTQTGGTLYLQGAAINNSSASTNSGRVYVAGGASTAPSTVAGGPIVMLGGASANGAGGLVTLQGGAGYTTGGAVTISSGADDTLAPGNSGNVSIYTPAGSVASGTLTLAAGGTTPMITLNGTSQNVTINPSNLFTVTSGAVGSINNVTVGATTSATGKFTTLRAAAYLETKVTMAANAIDLATGNYFSKTISGATTFTVSNVSTTGIANSFILDLTNGGSAAITWFSGIKWVAGTAPALTTAGRDALGFFTHDGGTTWTGLVLGKDIK